MAIWDPEIVVDLALARELIDAQFPGLAPASLQLLGAGWDNTAYIVNDSLVFRFPRRTIAVSLIATESMLLPWLAPQLPAPIPTPLYVGSPSARYAWPFAGYRFIAGRTLPSARVSDADRAALAAPLGRFLAALHAVPADSASTHGAGPDTLARMDHTPRVATTRERLSTLTARAGLGDCAWIERLLEEPPLVARSDTLVHGDVYGAHVLVDDSGQLAGVIDWGDVHIGDPLIDLAGALTILPETALETFAAAYGPVERSQWRFARIRAVWHTVAVLAHADDTGQAALAADARRALLRLENSTW